MVGAKDMLYTLTGSATKNNDCQSKNTGAGLNKGGKRKQLRVRTLLKNFQQEKNAYAICQLQYKEKIYSLI